MSVCTFSKVMEKDKYRLEREREASPSYRYARTQLVSSPCQLVAEHVPPGLSVATSLDREPATFYTDRNNVLIISVQVGQLLRIQVRMAGVT